MKTDYISSILKRMPLFSKLYAILVSSSGLRIIATRASLFFLLIKESS